MNNILLRMLLIWEWDICGSKMKKLKDFDDTEQRNIRDELESVAIFMGHDSWESSDPTYKYSELEELLKVALKERQ